MTEDQAAEILKEAIKPSGGLYNLGWYLDWSGQKTAVMDGEFTADQLEAIAWWMRNKKPTSRTPE